MSFDTMLSLIVCFWSYFFCCSFFFFFIFSPSVSVLFFSPTSFCTVSCVLSIFFSLFFLSVFVSQIPKFRNLGLFWQIIKLCQTRVSEKKSKMSDLGVKYYFCDFDGGWKHIKNDGKINRWYNWNGHALKFCTEQFVMLYDSYLQKPA